MHSKDDGTFPYLQSVHSVPLIVVVIGFITVLLDVYNERCEDPGLNLAMGVAFITTFTEIQPWAQAARPCCSS